jgi:integrase
MISVLRHGGRAESTIKQYCYEVQRFFTWLGWNRPLSVRRSHIISYLDHCASRSIGYRKMAHAALRAFFLHTLNRTDVVANIPWPRVAAPLRIPPRLVDIHRMLPAVRDPRCRAALQIIVGAGLRVSEVCALRVEDVQVERDAQGRRADLGVIVVRKGKGGKDRLAPLPPTLLRELRHYWRQMKPRTWLFPNRRADGPIDPPLLRRALTEACLACGVPRWTPHLLRHAYATAMLEERTELPSIQNSMGHRRLSTTSVYMHVRRDQIMAMPDLLAPRT